MIYPAIPYRLDKNIGRFYNDFMSMLPSDDDFACFVDGDTLLLTYHWGHQLQQVVDEHPNCGLFTAVTNRVGCPWQVNDEGAALGDDIRDHRELAEELWNRYGTACMERTRPPDARWMSGFLMMLRKSTWKNLGGFREGMLGVDNDIHEKAANKGEQVLQMCGVYLYHWYRGGNQRYKEHLQ